MNCRTPGQLSVALRPDSRSERCCPGSCLPRMGGWGVARGQTVTVWLCTLAILGRLLATLFSQSSM